MLFLATVNGARSARSIFVPMRYFTVILMVAFLPLAALTVIFALPFFNAVTLPAAETLATFSLEENQVRKRAASWGVSFTLSVSA